MIHSTSSSDRPVQPNAVDSASSRAAQSSGPRPDRLSFRHQEHLREALRAQPEIRPEALARARALAADPAYPSAEVLRQVAAAILAAPDHSEETA